jgi:hypothetical protein
MKIHLVAVAFVSYRKFLKLGVSRNSDPDCRVYTPKPGAASRTCPRGAADCAPDFASPLDIAF